MKFLKNIKKDEIAATVTRAASKYGYKLKKASPTIMIVAAGIGGVTAAVLACKATLKAEVIMEEHKAQVASIHAVKEQIDKGEIELKDGETYTEEDLKKDITTTYIQTGIKLAKVYAPAVTLGAVSLGCMFGSHHIMSKRNASLTAAYIALDKAFNEYKGRVTERFGDRVQQELAQNIKAVEIESKQTDENGVEGIIKEYKDVAEKKTDPYSFIFDNHVDSWQPDDMLNKVHINQVLTAANRKLYYEGHLFLNDVLDMIDPYGHGRWHSPIGQIVGWVNDPDDAEASKIKFTLIPWNPNDCKENIEHGYVDPYYMIRFNCDGPIIDKI